MGLFTTSSRRGTARPSDESPVATGGTSQEMSECLRVGVLARFEAVGEALAAGTGTHAACAVVGRELARDGVDLTEALDGLRSTFAHLTGRQPDFESTQALSVAWSDETLGYLHQVSCENPLTGLATLAHLRARLAEVQRGAEVSGVPATEGQALVVIDLPDHGLGDTRDPMGRALELARVADRARLVFAGEESIGEASPSRLLVLAPRTDDLGLRVVVLRFRRGIFMPGVAGGPTVDVSWPLDSRRPTLGRRRSPLLGTTAAPGSRSTTWSRPQEGDRECRSRYTRTRTWTSATE
jgi:hypothetical protein